MVYNFKKVTIKILAPIAGFIVYWLSKFIAYYFNLLKKRDKLDSKYIERLSILLVDIDFKKVRIINKAFLPANIFNNKIAGMTYGSSIYTTYPDLLSDYEGLNTLIHEMVHVGQMQKLRQWKFSLHYGYQFFENGGYSDQMPLEKEAYNFVRFIPFDPAWYIGHNSDLAGIIKGSEKNAFDHWLEKGIYEDRQACAWFRASRYLSRYKDIRELYGSKDYPAAIRHWILIGKYENRQGL